MAQANLYDEMQGDYPSSGLPVQNICLLFLYISFPLLFFSWILLHFFNMKNVSWAIFFLFLLLYCSCYFSLYYFPPPFSLGCVITMCPYRVWLVWRDIVGVCYLIVKDYAGPFAYWRSFCVYSFKPRHLFCTGRFAC